ncbi:WbuC family cupin fold metalloprotein [Bosea sp. (in: a-proteobacteria)]|uniref:WbuC family cupin fold metalloprotein n=2 Tax=Bosea sp. (in: a-proteobacteria) TaxID=1871050 RepID=UPI0040340DB1
MNQSRDQEMDELPARLRTISPEVLYSDGGFLAVDGSIVEILKQRAAMAPRRRCRLCFHADSSDAQQEMLIVMHRDSYVQPHCHIGKVETLSIIEGTADALLFSADGALTGTVPMSPAAQGGAFFYRMPEGQYHSLRFRSEWLVFLETTIGPFDRSTTRTGSWSPPETEPAAGHAFLAALRGSLA